MKTKIMNTRVLLAINAILLSAILALLLVFGYTENSYNIDEYLSDYFAGETIAVEVNGFMVPIDEYNKMEEERIKKIYEK